MSKCFNVCHTRISTDDEYNVVEQARSCNTPREQQQQTHIQSDGSTVGNGDDTSSTSGRRKDEFPRGGYQEADDGFYHAHSYDNGEDGFNYPQPSPYDLVREEQLQQLHDHLQQTQLQQQHAHYHQTSQDTMRAPVGSESK